MRPPPRDRAGLLRAVRHGARARSPLLPFVWGAGRRLTSPTSWRLYRSECGFDVPDFDRRRASMRQTVQFTLAAALIGLAAAACGEGTAPTSGQAEVLAAEADQLGAMVDSDFGAAGAAATAALTSSGSGVLAAPAGT